MSLKAAVIEFSTRFRIKRDPITGRLICEKCWNMVHGTEARPICRHQVCDCLCKDRKLEALK